MKTKKTVLMAVIGMVILSLSGFGYAVETHTNGWIYPAGTSKHGYCKGDWRPSWYPEHVGLDYELSPGDSVYSIANDGEIVDYSNALKDYGTACGGTGGAILVKYETADYIVFYAVYGHCYIKEGLKIGSKVSSGEVIGYIHEYYGKDNSGVCNIAMHHLHFGIHPNTIDSERPFRGVGTATDDFGWVNPTAFLNEHFPIYCNLLSFDFPNHSSQGWQCGSNTEVAQGNDLNTWQVHITGNNPGVESPSFSCGLMAKDAVIKFSARVLGNDYSGRALMYLFDETGSWNNEIQVGNVDMSNNYREYTVDLSSARSDLEIKKFSLELTSGGSGNDEYWALDWLKICSKATSWDFTDSQLGWTIVSDAQFADIYPNGSGYFRMEATEKQPRIASPYLYNLSPDFKMLALKYSVRMDKDSAGNFKTDLQDPLANIYFDLGGGIASAKVVQAPIKRDGKNQEILCDIPADIRGKIARVYVDIFDSADYEKKLIAIDRVDFLGSEITDEQDKAYDKLVKLPVGYRMAMPSEQGGGEFFDPFEGIESSLTGTGFNGNTNLLPEDRLPSDINVKVWDRGAEIRWNGTNGLGYWVSVFDYSIPINFAQSMCYGCTFSGLYPDTTYSVRVISYNQKFKTEPIYIRTLPQGQGKCSGTDIPDVSLNPATLMWKEIACNTEAFGILQNFTLDVWNTWYAQLEVAEHEGYDGQSCMRLFNRKCENATRSIIRKTGLKLNDNKYYVITFYARAENPAQSGNYADAVILRLMRNRTPYDNQGFFISRSGNYSDGEKFIYITSAGWKKYIYVFKTEHPAQDPMNINFEMLTGRVNGYLWLDELEIRETDEANLGSVLAEEITSASPISATVSAEIRAAYPELP